MKSLILHSKKRQIGDNRINILGLEFCYSQAPETMKSLIVAFFYLSIAIGSYLGTYFLSSKSKHILTLYLGSALVEIVNLNKNDPWIGNDLNKSHLDYYFFLLGGMFIFFE